MRIGVTGGTGFIGQYLLKAGAEEHEFVVAFSGRADRSLYEHQNIVYSKSDYSQGSFEDLFEGCDAIVHLGAKRPDKNSEDSFMSYAVNIETSEALFKAARDIGIKNVVNISSRSVYSPELHMPFKEEITEPYNKYGIAKLTVENIAVIYNKSFGMKIKSLRLAQVTGYGEKPNLINSVYLRRCIEKEPLMVYGKGISSKEYIYVKDVAAAILKACACPDKSGVYNIGTGELTSNYELAKMYCDALCNPAGVILLEDKPEDGMRFVMNVNKAKIELGFEAEFTVNDFIRDIYSEIKRN